MEFADDVNAETLRVVTVCTHNRTRSVMSMAMIQAGLDARLGVGRVVVDSVGIEPGGQPPIPDAVEAMRRRGLDVASHRSRRLTAERLACADLVLVSEKRHVVAVAGAVPELFSVTFTLPEFCRLTEAGGLPYGSTLAERLERLGAGRNAAGYLRGDVPELADPTGLSRRRFESAVKRIEKMCAAAVDALAAEN